MPTLALVRHGQSEWNLTDRFTGWWDVNLTPVGEGEAWASGRLLKASGVEFTRAYVRNITSELGTCAVLTDLHSLNEADLKAVRARQRLFSRRLIKLIKLGIEDGSIQVKDSRVAVSWIVSGPLMIPKLIDLWKKQGTAWLAEHYAEFTRRSLSA